MSEAERQRKEQNRARARHARLRNLKKARSAMWTKTPLETEQRVNREIALAHAEIKRMQSQLKKL